MSSFKGLQQHHDPDHDKKDAGEDVCPEHAVICTDFSRQDPSSHSIPGKGGGQRQHSPECRHDQSISIQFYQIGTSLRRDPIGPQRQSK